MDKTKGETVDAQLAELRDDFLQIIRDLSNGKIDSKQARAAHEPLHRKLREIQNAIRPAR